ncbi:MAG: helix-hairpin-helix domain-containing protein [Oscillospiraceae bacterium]|nr:helix-hairpin-helix domain-containing protein [Oscillospiraceae bacterium]
MKKFIFALIAAAGVLAAGGAGLFVLVNENPRAQMTFRVTSQTASGSEFEAAASPADRMPETSAAESTSVPEIQETTTTPNRDLNTATEAELQRVNGVGAALAERIVQYRTQIGGFRRRAELCDVPGIGETIAARIMEEFGIPDELPPETSAVTTAASATTAAKPVTTTAAAATEAETTVTETHPVYALNEVTIAELLTVPGMDEEHAQSILELREKIGGYGSVYEICYLDFSAEYVKHTLSEYLYVEDDPNA